MSTLQEHEGRRANAGRKGEQPVTVAMIFARLRPARNPRPTEEAVLERARAEVARVRDVLELRSTAPSYVYRGYCEDCEGPAVLRDGTRCEACGSLSTVLVSQGWVGKKKPGWRDEVAA